MKTGILAARHFLFWAGVGVLGAATGGLNAAGYDQQRNAYAAPRLPPAPAQPPAPSVQAPLDPGYAALIATCKTPPTTGGRGRGGARGGTRGGSPPGVRDYVVRDI